MEAPTGRQLLLNLMLSLASYLPLSDREKITCSTTVTRMSTLRLDCLFLGVMTLLLSNYGLRQMSGGDLQ